MYRTIVIAFSTLDGGHRRPRRPRRNPERKRLRARVGYCASATFRDKMVASEQTLMARHCAASMGRPHPVDRPSHGHDRAAGFRTATAYGSQLAASLAGRGWSVISALHSGRLRGEGDQPGELDSSTIPRAFGRCSMSWTGWPRIPVQPGRSRTDRQTCGGRGSAADLPADTDLWHQCRAGDIRPKFPRDYGDPCGRPGQPGTGRRAAGRPEESQPRKGERRWSCPGPLAPR